MSMFNIGPQTPLTAPTQDELSYMPPQVMQQAPPMSPMFKEEDPEFTKWRLSSDEYINRVLMNLQGYTQDENGEWVLDKNKKSILNAKGANAIGVYFDSILNPGVLQANIEKSDFNYMMCEIMNTFDGMIMVSGKEYGIPRQSWDMIHTILEVNARSALSRALGGQERKGIVENVSRQETVMLNPTQRKSVIPGFGVFGK